MKWLNLLFIGVAIVAFNACERHSASELKLIQLPNERPVETSQNTAAAPQSAAPSDDSKPAPGYIK